MGKKAKEQAQEEAQASEERPEYEELVARVNGIAKPLAGKKLTKRLYRTVKKGNF